MNYIPMFKLTIYYIKDSSGVCKTLAVKQQVEEKVRNLSMGVSEIIFETLISRKL